MASFSALQWGSLDHIYSISVFGLDLRSLPQPLGSASYTVIIEEGLLGPQSMQPLQSQSSLFLGSQ